MSDPIDPPRPDVPTNADGTPYELRRRGRLLGLAYAFGLRISGLPTVAPEGSRPPLLPASGRPALPAAPERTPVAEQDGTGPREPEDGT